MDNKDKGRKLEWGLFAVAFAVCLGWAFVKKIDTWGGDAAYFWLISDPVYEHGFDILNFPETFRGYLFPLILGGLKQFLPDKLGWRILSAAMISLCFSHILPRLFLLQSISTVSEWIRSLFAFIVFMWIWGDFMQYPMSDFPAAISIIAAVVILRPIVDSKESLKVIEVNARGIVAGILLYAAYNTRAAYLYGVGLAVIIFIIMLIKRKRNLYVLAVIALGIIVAAVPQSMINKKYVDSYSPKVYTENFSGYAQNLQKQQVYWGLYYEKNDGYVPGGDEAVLNAPNANLVGRELLIRQIGPVENLNLWTLAKMAIKYPLDTAVIYIKHLIILITPVTREYNPTNVHSGKGILITISILIWIVAVIGIMYTNNRKRTLSEALWIVPIVLPSFLQLFGTPEIRFFIAVYILAYYYVFAVIDYKNLWNSIKHRWIRALFVSVVIYMLWISVYSDTLIFHDTNTVFMINDR